MRARFTILVLSMVVMGHAQFAPRYNAEERNQIVAFWSRPDRYTVGLPADALEKGPWQVRLTVAGSSWLWAYQKGKRLPPTQDVPPTVTDDENDWEKWIVARIAFDRYNAWQAAQRTNSDLGAPGLPMPDGSIPVDPPLDPGPPPPGLRAAYGDPPPFAQPASPLEYRVNFDDISITYRDWFRPYSPRYAFFRFEKGVGDGGTAVKSMPPDRMNGLFRIAGVTEPEARVMRAVSLLEGGFDSVNTYDTGFVSVGFIQFACLREGGGSLGGLLKTYRATKPYEFRRDFHDFGVDVSDDGKLVVLDPTTGGEFTGADAAARIIDDKRLIAVFTRAGRLSESFLASQIRAAKAMFFPADDAVTVTAGDRTFTGKVSDIFHSEAGLAALMDRKVNTGNINILGSTLSNLATSIKAQSLADLIPYEKSLILAVRYRRDFLNDASLSQPPEPPALGRDLPLTSRGSGGTRGGRIAPAVREATPPKAVAPKAKPEVPVKKPVIQPLATKPLAAPSKTSKQRNSNANKKVTKSPKKPTATGSSAKVTKQSKPGKGPTKRTLDRTTVRDRGDAKKGATIPHGNKRSRTIRRSGDRPVGSHRPD